MQNKLKHIIISCCNDCGLSEYNSVDGTWFCAHRFVRDEGLYISITRPDGRPYTTGVSRRCPLTKCDTVYQLAKDVKLI